MTSFKKSNRISFLLLTLYYCLFSFADANGASCQLHSKFQKATLKSGVKYYTDRNYTLKCVPLKYDGSPMIRTPNQDRNRTDASGYLTFTMPYDGYVYVALDRRALEPETPPEGQWWDALITPPWWMYDMYFYPTGDTISTSLSSQGHMELWRGYFYEGQCVNLGANKAPGYSGKTIVGNYIVFYTHAPGDSCGQEHGGEIYDCDIHCLSENMLMNRIGNGLCDDGTNNSVNLMCREFNHDGGDCYQPGDSCGQGMVYDCEKACVDEATAKSWIGDGYCDNGTYGMDLRCPEFNNDGGDCAGSIL